MAVSTELFKARDEFVSEYLIEKPKVYGVDFTLFSSMRVASPEQTWAANIVGVGIGEKYSGGMPTGETALRAYVVEKLSKDVVNNMPRELRIPEVYTDVHTDVIAVGRPALRQITISIGGINTNYVRPAPGGFSIGNENEHSAGTLGCLVSDRDDSSKLYILSNNHVIARENNASPAEKILQPGRLDGGTHPGIAEYEPRNDRVHIDSAHMNIVDAALARVTNASMASPEISGIGRIKGFARPCEKRWVTKSGRTTGLSRGFIDDIYATLKIPFAGGIALFMDQILIFGVPSVTALSAPTAGFVIPFSAPGDSGSIIMDEATGYAVGLLFAGSDRYNITYANKIENALIQLNVDLVA